MSNVSKKLSYILRHNHEPLEMDRNGWVDTDELIKHLGITLNELKKIVWTNNKQRFIFNEDGDKIRANQGHSLDVDVELKEEVPPDVLYHGTSWESSTSIFTSGLKKMGRLHVHLSADKDTAWKVGRRHGRAVVYAIDAEKMYGDGIKFYLSENGVWLTDYVDEGYIYFEHH